jgi:hypothetical protein
MSSSRSNLNFDVMTFHLFRAGMDEKKAVIEPIHVDQRDMQARHFT